jgi:hypothetical protein
MMMAVQNSKLVFSLLHSKHLYDLSSRYLNLG